MVNFKSFQLYNLKITLKWKLSTFNVKFMKFVGSV